MLYEPQLNEAKQLIDVGDKASAKAIVVPYLQKNPQSADAWWLFSLLTDTDSDAVLALQRALAIDPTHYEANRALEKLQSKLGIPTEVDQVREATPSIPIPPVSSPPKPTLGSYEIIGERTGEPIEFPFEERSSPKVSSRPPSESAARVATFAQQTPNAMEAVARAYASYGWTAIQFSPQKVVMQKKTGMDWFWPCVLLMIPFVGLTLLVTNFFIRRTYTIIITPLSRGRQLRFEGAVKTVTLNQEAILSGNASMPMPEIETNYLTAIMIGGIASVVVICGLCLGLILLVDVDDEGDDASTLGEGDTAYVLSDTEVCIDLHRLPGPNTPILFQWPKGEQVTITLRVEREDLDEVWYEVRSMSTEMTGWLPASNVGNELDNVSLPPQPCN